MNLSNEELRRIEKRLLVGHESRPATQLESDLARELLAAREAIDKVRVQVVDAYLATYGEAVKGGTERREKTVSAPDNDEMLEAYARELGMTEEDLRAFAKDVLGDEILRISPMSSLEKDLNEETRIKVRNHLRLVDATARGRPLLRAKVVMELASALLGDLESEKMIRRWHDDLGEDPS